MTRPCRALESPERSAGLLPREWSRRALREVSPAGSQCAQSALPCFSPFQTRDATYGRTIGGDCVAPTAWYAGARMGNTMHEALAPWVEYDANGRPSLNKSHCSTNRRQRLALSAFSFSL